MLNGKELIERKIITNVPEENVQQHGIDLNVIEIELLTGGGVIPHQGKTVLGNSVQQPLISDQAIWKLHPGTYSVRFSQGCDIPSDTMLLIRQRSSLLRNGTILHSSVFDTSFKTDNIGTVMIVTVPITIQYKARIAQIYNHNCTLVENLYNGQFQNDKQRDGAK